MINAVQEELCDGVEPMFSGRVDIFKPPGWGTQYIARTSDKVYVGS
jgi:hypothetical protein